MNNQFSTKISVGIQSLTELKNDWIALEKLANSHPFDSFFWCLNQAHLHTEKGRTVIVVCVYDLDRCVAILPLVQQNMSRKLKIPCLQHLCSAFTDYQNFTFAPSEDSDTLFQRCISKLAESEYANLPLIFNYPSSVLRQCCLSAKRYFREHIAFNHWHHSQYKSDAAPLNSKVLREAKRRRKKLAQHANYEILINTAYDEKLIDWILDQNAKRFGPNQLTAAKNRTSVKRLLRTYQSSLHLSVVTIDGLPAAAHLGFLRDSTLQYYLLANDDNFRQFSVGIILLNEIIAVHSNPSNIDFLRGDEEYKKDWSNTVNIENGLICLPRKINIITAWLIKIYAKRNQ